MIKTLLALTALILTTSLAWAQEDDGDEASPKLCPALQASTVFVSDATGRRQDGSAKKITDTHREAESRGWDFDDLEIYIENGDLQGFFITYTRPHPCNKTLAGTP